MTAYLIRRLFLIVPTLFGIMLINFLIIQAAPGGPVEQLIAELTQRNVDASQRVTREGSEVTAPTPQPGESNSAYRGAQGLPPEFIAEIEKQYGFDKPLAERFFMMLGDYVVFDFGKSFFRDQSVVDLVIDKMPVSISLGLWTTLLAYLISIPLGIRKAVRDGSRFDVWTSVVLSALTAIPGYLFAVLLILVFAAGGYFPWFPLGGLVSENWSELGTWAQISDYLWHMVLPITALVIGGFASMTMLTKNFFLDQLSQQYVITARAKGLTQKRVLYGHVFRNAMLLVIAGFPAAFVSILFTGAVLVEVIFSLDGLGYLGFEAVLRRDYPVMFGTLYFFSLLGLLMNIVGDLTYALVDPRIDFERRG